MAKIRCPSRMEIILTEMYIEETDEKNLDIYREEPIVDLTISEKAKPEKSGDAKPRILGRLIRKNGGTDSRASEETLLDAQSACLRSETGAFFILHHPQEMIPVP